MPGASATPGTVDQPSSITRRAAGRDAPPAAAADGPAKDLAAILDVNTNTVLRSLRMLRDEAE